jgi:hypothetical protein
MVHVEIEHGDTGITVLGESVGCTYCDVVEQAKAHGLIALGMVAGRTHGTEGVFDFAGRNEIHGSDDGAGRPAGGIQ